MALYFVSAAFRKHFRRYVDSNIILSKLIATLLVAGWNEVGATRLDIILASDNQWKITRRYVYLKISYGKLVGWKIVKSIKLSPLTQKSLPVTRSIE